MAGKAITDPRHFQGSLFPSETEGVSVEQDIPGYGVPINGKEDVDAETMKRAEKTRVCIIHGGAAARSRPDQIRSKIVQDVTAKTHLAAQIDSGVGISDSDSPVGNAVESKTSRTSDLQPSPLALEIHVQHGLVVELIRPPLGFGRIRPVVDLLLAVLRIGMVSDFLASSSPARDGRGKNRRGRLRIRAIAGNGFGFTSRHPSVWSLCSPVTPPRPAPCKA